MRWTGHRIEPGWLLALLLLLGGGCAAPRQSAGCDAAYRSGKPLGRLICDAERGVPAAQLLLGRLYEEGQGVDADPARAAALYAAAAADVAPTTAIYVPAVGRTAGHVMLMPNANARTGLAAARFRLGRLYIDGRGVEQNRDRGRHLIERAAEAGDPDAQAWLAANPTP